MKKVVQKNNGIAIFLTILGWFFWLFFAILGLVAVLMKPVPWILLLIMSAMFIPKTVDFLENKSWFSLKISYRIITILVCFFALPFSIWPVSQKVPVTNNETIKTTDEVTYSIVKVEDQSHKALWEKSLSEYSASEIKNLPMDKKMLYRVILSTEVKETQIKPTIDKIISDIIKTDNDIDEITIFLYSDKNLADGPYDIGTGTWAPFGKLWHVDASIAKYNIRTNYEIKYSIKEWLEKYLEQRTKSENKFGLSEEQRRSIFKEFIAAEDRAHGEAEKMFPTYGTAIGNLSPEALRKILYKNIEKSNELMEKYKDEVRKKNSLDKKEEDQIVTEWLLENWPAK